MKGKVKAEKLNSDGRLSTKSATSQKVLVDIKSSEQKGLSVLCILSMRVAIEIPSIPEEQKSGLVVQLLEIIKSTG
jgi:hypothetical protein